VDKLALDGRVKWVEDNLGAILENADNPFSRSGASVAAEEGGEEGGEG
jgi:hypothetical protein